MPSPNSTFDEDTIKHNSSIISPPSNSANEQLFPFEESNIPFHPVPPPPINYHGFLQSTSQQNSFHDINLSQYSIFSNRHAMNSVNSLNPPVSELNDDFIYNVSEFDLGNPSFESIPDTTFDNSFELNESFLNYPPTSSSLPQNSSFSNELYPYTPTLSDYTPTLSDTSSFTPNSTLNTEDYIRAPIPLKSSHYHLHNLTTSVTPPLSSGLKISKKPSLNRLNNSINNKKNLVITTQIANSTTPLSDSSLINGISPLCNKYKGLEINTQRIMPPLNVFRHNSDSSSSSYENSTPRRKNYPSLNEVSNQRSTLSRRDSINTISATTDESPNSVGSPTSSISTSLPVLQNSSLPLPVSTPVNKPKKYTRRRLLPRSKNGCWICRIKHLKCDELRPACASCTKFGIACDYSPEKPAYVTDKALRKEKLDNILSMRKAKQSLAKKGRKDSFVGKV